MQTLWHMVSRSQQVFVVGEIQTDGTVVGGTGWSVELARMWDKELWVYDQVQCGWFRWNQRSWEKGTPVISSSHHCGTGTRYLTDDGRAATENLIVVLPHSRDERTQPVRLGTQEFVLKPA